MIYKTIYVLYRVALQQDFAVSRMFNNDSSNSRCQDPQVYSSLIRKNHFLYNSTSSFTSLTQYFNVIIIIITSAVSS